MNACLKLIWKDEITSYEFTYKRVSIYFSFYCVTNVNKEFYESRYEKIRCLLTFLPSYPAFSLWKHKQKSFHIIFILNKIFCDSISH